MTGVTTMGDFSHELESLLMRIDQGGIGLDDAAYSLLQASIDELHRMREQVLSGSVSPPSQDLMARLAGVVEATMMTPALLADNQEPETESAAAGAEPEDKTVPELPVTLVSEDEAGESIAAAEKATDADVSEKTHPLADEKPSDKRPLVPEPDRLGELARELTDGQPPEIPQPLPDDFVSTLAVQAPAGAASRKEMARVDSAMLEDLLNNAGEISIFHSRLNQQMSSIQFNLVELGQTVQRLQKQLRLLEGETEAQILFRHQSEAEGDEAFDPLELDRYSTIQQLSRGLAETASDVSSIKDLLQNLASDTESILTQQTRTTSDLQDKLMRTRMVPFDQHVPRLSRLVRQQAIESGKNVELVVEGSSGELDRQVMEKMLPPLEHMLRNAVNHGIEDPATRQQVGKPDVATIVIRFRREGAQVLIDIVDDGAGLDLASVRQKAVEQGVIKADQQLTDEEVSQLILKSGLSTAEKLTQSAGRGIGMDVVTSEIAKLGGMLAINSVAGQGCTFTVRLPYTLAITQAFIVKVANEVFALPLPTVEGIVRLSRKEFDERLLQAEPAVEYGGRSYRLRHLGVYLGLGPATLPADEDQVALILVDAGENSAALIVDETADSREIVVKSIGPQLAAIRGIAGATILGDGRIVVILDPGSLVRSTLRGDVEIQPVVTIEEDLPPLALVVDDSITMRRVTQRLLERNKMRVLTAKDGIEALEVLQDHMPEIVILDIEMPRMDGYEFAKNVRNTPATADLPIIMVTSRTGEKHRARAIELGINDYLGKPYQEHELLDAIRNILGEFNVGDKARQRDTVL
jgi:chemosensory pili system protein ChpA (sensor histidine kinase/response regulator)